MPRKKKMELSEEELLKQRLETKLNDLKERLYLIPEPTYLFNVGDKVIIGNLHDVKIEQVLEDGKIYLIDYSSIDNYGNPVKHEHQKQYVEWFDIRKYQENTSAELIKNEDIRMEFMHQTIESLLTKVYYFGVDFNPEYQRDFVWNLEDKVSLIDSIFNNVEIGKFVFIHLGYTGNYTYEVLDGKQRLRAILDFYEDRFQYKGKYFSDLSKKEQNFIRNYSVTVAETKEQLTRKQKLRYFLKLNKAGHVMAKEQLDKVEKMLNEIKE